MFKTETVNNTGGGDAAERRANQGARLDNKTTSRQQHGDLLCSGRAPYVPRLHVCIAAPPRGKQKRETKGWREGRGTQFDGDVVTCGRGKRQGETGGGTRGHRKTERQRVDTRKSQEDTAKTGGRHRETGTFVVCFFFFFLVMSCLVSPGLCRVMEGPFSSVR